MITKEKIEELVAEFVKGYIKATIMRTKLLEYGMRLDFASILIRSVKTDIKNMKKKNRKDTLLNRTTAAKDRLQHFMKCGMSVEVVELELIMGRFSYK